MSRQLGEGRKSITAVRLQRPRPHDLTDHRSRARPREKIVRRHSPTSLTGPFELRGWARLRRRVRGLRRATPARSQSRARSTPTRSCDLSAGHLTLLRCRQRRRRALPAPPRADGARPSSISTRHGDVDAAIIAYPHGASAPTVARAARTPRREGHRHLRRLPPARPRRPTSSALVPCQHAAPGPDRPGRIRAARALPRADRWRGAGRQSRLLSDPPDDPRARAAGAGWADRRRRGRRQVGCLRRRPRGDRQDALRHGRPRNVVAYKVRRAPPHAGDRAGAGRRSAADPSPKVTFVPHLLPLDQGELVSCYVTLTDRDRSRRACAGTRSTTTPTPSEPFVEVLDRAGRCLRANVRDTNICEISVHRGGAHRPDLTCLRRDRQHLEGDVVPGDPRTST